MLKGEILVYGLAKGEKERYMEVRLSSNCKSEADVKKVMAVASAEGWHSFRAVYHMPLKKP